MGTWSEKCNADFTLTTTLSFSRLLFSGLFFRGVVAGPLTFRTASRICNPQHTRQRENAHRHAHRECTSACASYPSPSLRLLMYLVSPAPAQSKAAGRRVRRMQQNGTVG